MKKGLVRFKSFMGKLPYLSLDILQKQWAKDLKTYLGYEREIMHLSLCNLEKRDRY